MMELVLSRPPITQAEFIAGLVERFPAVAPEVLEEQGYLHLQVSFWAHYVNACFTQGNVEEVARSIAYFQQTGEKVDSYTENALYVSFLEHLAFEGESQVLEKAQQARLLLAPPSRAAWQQLRAY